MRWSRLFFLVFFLGLLGCSNPSAPKYPQPEENPGGEPDPNEQGLVVSFDGTTWA